MCDAVCGRRSRRKQHTPSRRCGVGEAVPDVHHGTCNADCGDRADNTETAIVKLDKNARQEVGGNVSPLENERYGLQEAEMMQQLSSIYPISSTPSSTASTDSTGLLPETCRRDISPSQYSSLPHVLYLPIAFHNNSNNNVQVLGYPQVIIPVAIHRDAQEFIKPFVVIDEFLARNIVVPNQIYFGQAQCKLEITPTQHSHTAYSRPSTSSDALNTRSMKRKEAVSNGFGKKRVSPNELKPLDLTVRMKQAAQDANSNSSNCDSADEDSYIHDKVASCDTDKKFRCDCGVSFNSELTLSGHKKYYCNNNASHETPFREPQKKMSYRCQQCDFLPASASQLAQHVRVNHAAVQAYVCRICGYKGYSQRGIRSHLRNHMEYSNEKTEDLLAAHVHFITTDSNTAHCVSRHRNK